MSTTKTKVGIVGCGNISQIYFNGCKMMEALEVVACADIVHDRATACAEQYGVRALTVDELMKDPEVELVVNLTIPQAHAEISLAALNAGKHVYTEKPFATNREEGRKILELARSKGLKVGCAPDTFMGAGIQTCIKLLDDGAIGEPVAATAFMTGHGPESWHPNCDFYYKKGVGPMLDMGPYYLTAMIAMMGPVKRVAGATRVTFPERTFTCPQRNGEKITVEVPTHITGILDFECGAVATMITSCDVWGANLPLLEIYGTEGTISMPDPNTFGGPVRLLKAGGEWANIELTHSYPEQSRGLGIADMAYAIGLERPLRASGEMAFHTLDVMQSIHESSDRGEHIELESTCVRPAPLPMGIKRGLLDGQD